MSVGEVVSILRSFRDIYFFIKHLIVGAADIDKRLEMFSNLVTNPEKLSSWKHAILRADVSSTIHRGLGRVVVVILGGMEASLRGEA